MYNRDASVQPNAQNTSSLSGKVLRFNLDGTIPADNPIRRFTCLEFWASQSTRPWWLK